MGTKNSKRYSNFPRSYNARLTHYGCPNGANRRPTGLGTRVP